jgi:hypothetical protein
VKGKTAMTYDEAYLFLFSLLDKVYFSDEKRYNWLGALLGEMNPFLFTDGDSADPATKGNIIQKLKDKLDNVPSPTRMDVVSFVKPLLTEYHNKWGLDILDLLSDIGDNIEDFLLKHEIDFEHLPLLTKEDRGGFTKP